jgi:hypothetical protein
MRTSWLVARSVSLLLVCSLPALAQRTSRDRDPSRAADDWLDRCREGRSSNGRDDRERFCEVREKRIAATRMLDIDGNQNGSVSVHGWDRSEVYILAKVQTQGEDGGEARDVANRVTVEVDGGRLRADGP